MINLEQITAVLEAYMRREDLPTALCEAMKYSLLAGGKRLRQCAGHHGLPRHHR